MKKRLFDLIFIIISASMLVAFSEYGLLEKNISFSFIPILIAYFFGQYSNINGDGSNSRDFTYIDNVISMNLLVLSTTKESALNQIYNTAVGDRTSLIQLVHSLKKYLSKFDPTIANIKEIHGPNRYGDIPHSQASIEKAVRLLNYKPTHDFESGLKNVVEWYWKLFKS